MNTVETLKMPKGPPLDLAEARETIRRYLNESAAAVALYDSTNQGAHDSIEAVDLLSLNALNAFGAGAMTPMAEMWASRELIYPFVLAITKEPLEQLSSLREHEAAVCAALRSIETVRGWNGGTRAAKLLHRLRPNLAPIWDVRVHAWYQENEWEHFVRRAWGDIRANQSCLVSLRPETGPRLSIVRLWDILLWSREP